MDKSASANMSQNKKVPLHQFFSAGYRIYNTSSKKRAFVAPYFLLYSATLVNKHSRTEMDAFAPRLTRRTSLKSITLGQEARASASPKSGELYLGDENESMPFCFYNLFHAQ